MISNNTQIPELREWTETECSEWWRSHASNPLSFFASPCPHCGSRNVRMIIKSRDLLDGYDGKTYRVVQSAQVLCNNCHARGGLYEREIFHTPERPKMLRGDDWSMVQAGISFWNSRY